MKALKSLKKIDVRVVQGLLMACITALFVVLFYAFYQAYYNYRVAQHQPKAVVAPIEPLNPPQLFVFNPSQEETNRYQLFLFKEKKAENQQDGMDMPAQENFQILGVIKKVQLYLVVRLNSNNEIHLFARGQTIEEGFTVKQISLKEVVISDPTGSERVHPVFQMQSMSVVPAPAADPAMEQTQEPPLGETETINPEEPQKIE